MATSIVHHNAAENQAAPTTSGKVELFRQSISIPTVNTKEGVAKLFTDAEENFNWDLLCRFLNAGLRQNLNNAVRREFTQKDKAGNPVFQPVDGIYDATPLITKEPERQRLSFVEKLEKQLEGQPAAVKKAMLDAYYSNVGQEASEDITINTGEVVLYREGTGDEAKLVLKAAKKEEDEE